MSRKQLLLLFFGILVPWTIGNGLMPLLPIYAIKLGASQAIAGYYLAIAFLSLTAGTFFAGWLTDKVQRRKQLLIVAGIVLVPFIWMMGQVRNVWQLAAVTAMAWLAAGMIFALITTLAGLFAAKEERGRVIGIIGVTMGLGGIVGGLSIGPIVDHWGYSTMFLILSLFTVALPVVSIFIKDKKVARIPKKNAADRAEKPNFGMAFYALLIAQLVAVILNSLGPMGRSLSMGNLGFSATALTSTNVISGAVSLPIPLILGWLSDRLGRKNMMVICYVAFALSMIMLAISTSLWHFWILMILSKTGAVSMSVGAAFVTDLVKPKALGRGVALFQSMGWIAMTGGYVVAGNAFEGLGIIKTSFISTALPVIGIILILMIRVTKQKKATALAKNRNPQLMSRSVAGFH